MWPLQEHLVICLLADGVGAGELEHCPGLVANDRHGLEVPSSAREAAHAIAANVHLQYLSQEGYPCVREPVCRVPLERVGLQRVCPWRDCAAVIEAAEELKEYPAAGASKAVVCGLELDAVPLRLGPLVGLRVLCWTDSGACTPSEFGAGVI